MKRRPQSLGLLAVTFCCLAAFASGQDSDSPSPSLGDLARQTRAQKSSTATAPSKAQELANELQQEQEEAENAPIGYKTYNAGDYRLFVPFPYEVEGRDETGVVLAGSRVGVTNTVVVAGNPVAFPTNLDPDSERNLIGQIARVYLQASGCSVIKLGEHRAYRCGINKTQLLGNEVWGTMMFVMASGSVIPVMCVNPDNAHQCLTHDKFGYHTCDNQNPTWAQVQETAKQIQTRNNDLRTTAQVCDQVIYPSIRLREDSEKSLSAAVASKSMDKARAEGTTPAPKVPPHGGAEAVAQNNTGAGAGPSLADVVRQLKEAAASRPKAKVSVDATDGAGAPPPGYKSWSFPYCPSQSLCRQGYVFVPVSAVQVNKYYMENAFEVPLGPDRIELFAGPAGVNGLNRSSKDPDLARWIEANAADGTGVSGSVRAATRDEATIAGMPGFLTHFEVKRNDTIWVGVRANVVSRGVDVMVGCIAPQKRFGDADEICSTLIDSLRLP